MAERQGKPARLGKWILSNTSRTGSINEYTFMHVKRHVM